MSEKGKWIKEFPKEEGTYWFYGYRYGKVSCGIATKPEFMLVKVSQDGNRNPMYIADVHFMFEREVEEAHFMKAEFPAPPDIITKERSDE